MKKFNKSYLIIGSFLLAILGILFCSPKLVLSSPVSSNPIKVSIIVPVYNTEKYLNECLESLENQTLKEIEIICVNDGSKDNSLQILQEHAKNDNRIKIIDQENSGVSVSRNQGIAIAQGDYLIFCDSDDLIPPYAYEKVYNDAVKYDVNVVGLRLMRFWEGKETVDLSSFKYDPTKVKICSRDRFENPFGNMVDDTDFVVLKLWKRSFLIDNNLKFKEGVTNYEDHLFNFLAFSQITEMVQDENIFYCYRSGRPNSAVIFNEKKLLTSVTSIAQELVNHRDFFDFNGSDEWLLTKIMELNYSYIMNNVETLQAKKYYASKVVKAIDEDYLNKYGVIPSEENEKKLEELRKIAELN